MSRPSDGRDEFVVADEVVVPRLGAVEWLRWAWRQLTSMRTALLLLLALAVAAVPGSLLPQQSADPNGVLQWREANPGFVRVVDFLQGFTVYTSVWFSAIYLLLFVSLVGCVVPRLRHHLKAMRAAPPRTPSRFSRLPASSSVVLHGTAADDAVDSAERLLRGRRYRTARYGSSVSAERGYLRESGNLLFHFGLVGVLIAVFVGGGFTYTGQKVLVGDETFVNVQSQYDSFTPGRFFGDDSLQPFSLTLDGLDVVYEQENRDALGQPLDFTAHVTSRLADGEPQRGTIKVNHPLDIAGASVYLLGNGYAPHITVRDGSGAELFSRSVPFQPVVPQTMESLGVVKVPDTADPERQIGMRGFLYPTVIGTPGAYASLFPGLGDPLVSLNVYAGDLGVDSGLPQNVYELDNSAMTQVAGRDQDVKAIELTRADPTATLPDGLGTVTLDGITRFAAFDIHRDPSQNVVALFVGLSILGLITSLLVPRRRLWVKTTEQEDGALLVEYAGLARGDDPSLARAVAELQRDHGESLEPGSARVRV